MSKENKKTAPSENKHQPSATTAGATPVTASDPEAKNVNEATAVEVNAEETEWAPPRSIERHLRRKRQLQSGVPIITVTVSLVALLVIIAQAIIYNQQRQIMHRQVKVTEESLHISERAYVGVASLTANLAQGEVLILLENSGRIPAKNIRVEAQEYRVTANVVGSKTKFNAGSVSLFPGSYKMRVIVSMNKFRPEEIDAIQVKAESLVIAGKIQYEAGFGVEESTDFAFEYSPPRHEDWTAMSTWPTELGPVLEARAYSVSQNNGLTIVSTQPVDMKPSFGSKTYGRTPNQSWTPLSGPLSRADGSRPIQSWSPLSTPLVRPTLESRAYSPTPNQSSTPLRTPSADISRKLQDRPTGGGPCACGCAWVCGNRCEFSCSNCSLSGEISIIQSCCTEAHKATGDIGPCPR